MLETSCGASTRVLPDVRGLCVEPFVLWFPAFSKNGYFVSTVLERSGALWKALCEAGRINGGQEASGWVDAYVAGGASEAAAGKSGIVSGGGWAAP